MNTQLPVNEIVRNAVQCGICGTGADLHNHTHYQCQKNPNHIGDTFVGIFNDLTYPDNKND